MTAFESRADSIWSNPKKVDLTSPFLYLMRAAGRPLTARHEGLAFFVGERLGRGNQLGRDSFDSRIASVARHDAEHRLRRRRVKGLVVPSREVGRRPTVPLA
jgi:hypothetical protein